MSVLVCLSLCMVFGDVIVACQSVYLWSLYYCCECTLFLTAAHELPVIGLLQLNQLTNTRETCIAVILQSDLSLSSYTDIRDL